VMARNGSGGRKLRHTRLVLFCAVLALPSLTAAQTIFDVSGSIPESNGTVATFSGDPYRVGPEQHRHGHRKLGHSDASYRQREHCASSLYIHSNKFLFLPIPGRGI
jgi:hypothetical protein